MQAKNITWMLWTKDNTLNKLANRNKPKLTKGCAWPQRNIGGKPKNNINPFGDPYSLF